MKGELYSFRKNHSFNSQAFVLEATLTISLKEITSKVKFAERKSALIYYETKKFEKNSTFCSLTK